MLTIIITAIVAILMVALGALIAFFCYRQGLKDGRVKEGERLEPIKKEAETVSEMDEDLKDKYNAIMGYDPYA